jgi:NAD(P)-dependent dehydrogenase (short-subunit alcohol dehydrogenase family)
LTPTNAIDGDESANANSTREEENLAMTKTLITGASQGLGLHAARRLLAFGHEVWVTARDPGAGAQAAREIGAHFMQLDVTDDASVSAAAQAVAKTGGVDVIVNNAGIADRQPIVEATALAVQQILDTNVLGPVRIVHAFTQLLDASACPVVVNVSSALGSLTYSSDPEGPYSEINRLAYPVSKSALNMLTIQWAKAHPRWRVNSADPGFTATSLNQYRGTQTAEEGTDAIVQLAGIGPDGPTGGFFGRDGTVPW